ncbi:MAG: hypothetical protein ACRDNR_06750 [Gaiellaceae bacterium]
MDGRVLAQPVAQEPWRRDAAEVAGELTVSALLPPSEEQQYQGSGALATGAGLLTEAV